MGTNIVTIPNNMPTNFELKQLKPKLDIAKKPENRVHELTDSNISPMDRIHLGIWQGKVRICQFMHSIFRFFGDI